MCIKAKGARIDTLSLLTNNAVAETYLDVYQPKLWLFEGKNDGHLSARSIQEVFYRAIKTTGIKRM